jgi:prephenate dehydrogenase
MGTVSFSRVGIVGLGLIGGSLAAAVKRRFGGTEVVGVDRDRSTIEEARRRGWVGAGGTELKFLGGCELVIFCTPVKVIERQLDLLPPILPKNAWVTDVGSTKRGICRAALRTGSFSASGPVFVGGHPMAGSDASGIGAAREDLFEGRAFALCPVFEIDLAPLERFIQGLGARPVVLPPEEHDRAVGLISHLPHLSACMVSRVAGKLLGELPALADLASTGFRDASRHALSDPDLWEQILESNREGVMEGLSLLEEELRGAREAFSNGEIRAYLDQARASRRRFLCS